MTLAGCAATVRVHRLTPQQQAGGAFTLSSFVSVAHMSPTTLLMPCRVRRRW
jgi:hypothetical protein